MFKNLIDKPTKKVVEVDLPTDFCVGNDKARFLTLFINNWRTRGDEINQERSMYDEYSHKAIIYYENEDAAEAVADQRIIVIEKYKFTVRLRYEENYEDKSQPTRNSDVSVTNIKKLSSSSTNLSRFTNEPCKRFHEKKCCEKSKVVRVTSLQNTEMLGTEKIYNRFIFVRDDIIKIEFDPRFNCAIVKFNSADSKLYQLYF